MDNYNKKIVNTVKFNFNDIPKLENNNKYNYNNVNNNPKLKKSINNAKFIKTLSNNCLNLSLQNTKKNESILESQDSIYKKYLLFLTIKFYKK